MLHFIIHYKTFHYLPGSLTESIKVAGGFLLGLPHTATYFGQEFFSCGPMWYLLALLVGWILLDVILNIFPERYVSWAVGGAALLGWGTSLAWELPFCLIQGRGDHAVFVHRLPCQAAALAGLALVPPDVLHPVGSCSADPGGCLCHRQHRLRFHGRVYLRPHQHPAGRPCRPAVRPAVSAAEPAPERAGELFEAIGRRSLYIFCIHTVELTAIPWYLLAAKYADRPFVGIGLEYAFSLGSIWLVCALLQRRRELIIRLFPARRRTPAGALHCAALIFRKLLAMLMQTAFQHIAAAAAQLSL